VNGTPAAATRARRLTFHVGWASAWAVVGSVVALGIVVTRGGPLLPVWECSVLFAMVVGFTALTSARLVFPYFERLPYSVSLPLQILTLFSGTIFGSATVLLVQPLFAMARAQTVGVIVLVNALLAVVVGIALHTYDRMRRQIEASFEALRRKEALEREIAIARDVQRELLPRSIPVGRGLELAAVCLPAVGVGGDFYDFLPQPGDRMGIVVADVCGKGIPAALLMAGLQASLRSIALPGTTPAEVNQRLNESLHRSTADSRYATLFLAVWDGATRTLEYSNAAHYPPVLISDSEITRLPASGLPIGAFAEAKYGQARCTLKPGDLLAMFTDGIIEAPGKDDEEFGEKRLAKLLVAHRRDPLDGVLAAVLAEIGRFTGNRPPHDDLTLVLARVR